MAFKLAECWHLFFRGFGYVFGFIKLKNGQGLWFLWRLSFISMGSFHPVAIEAFVVIVLVGLCFVLEVYWILSSQPTALVKAILVLGFRRILKALVMAV